MAKWNITFNAEVVTFTSLGLDIFVDNPILSNLSYIFFGD